MPEQPVPTPEPVHPGIGYEERDVKLAPMLVTGAGIILLGLIAHLICLWMLDWFVDGAQKRDRGRSPVAKARADFSREADRAKIPQPQLQVSEELDMDRFRQSEEVELHSYGWIDKDKGTLHMPISQAIKLLSDPEFAKKRGILVTPKEKADPPGGKR